MSGNRDFQIKSRQSAIQRRLDKSNAKNKAASQKKAKGKRNFTWKAEEIEKGKGYTKTDHGVGSGAAIPYSITTSTKSNKATLPGAKPPPTTPHNTLPSNTKPGKNPPKAPTRPIGVNDGLNTWKNRRKPSTNTPLR